MGHYGRVLEKDMRVSMVEAEEIESRYWQQRRGLRLGVDHKQYNLSNVEGVLGEVVNGGLLPCLNYCHLQRTYCA